MSKLEKIFGYPNTGTLNEAWLITKKYRFMVWIYIFIVLLYIFFFVYNKDNTLECLNNNFGPGFGTSLSASFFEGLIMFFCLTLGITYISIKQSTINPEDQEFERRISAIMNSKNAKGDPKIFDFLKENIAQLLAYNKRLIYEIHVSNYFSEENTYEIIIRRVHILTNMCKDKDFESTNKSIAIRPDVKINNSFGKVLFLGTVNPNDLNHHIKVEIGDADNYQLKEGENIIPLEMPVKQDSEVGYKLSYSAFSKIDAPEKKESWLFSQATRYTRNIEFSIQNHLGDNMEFTFDFRIRKIDNSCIPIESNYKLAHLEDYSNSLNINFLPGERMEVYINAPVKN